LIRAENKNLLRKRSRKWLLLPASSLGIYLLLFALAPRKAEVALFASIAISFKIVVPLCLVFLLMFTMNLFWKPAQIAKLLGEKSGIRGLLISAVSGIVSVGPIYAWYPLLKELREHGASDALIAVFLNNRAVKPFLLPLLISYFGWVYVLLLMMFTILGAFACGYAVKAAGDHPRHRTGFS
jgi:uncharacterized membrane protein YraQ (UPF0718 family)